MVFFFLNRRYLEICSRSDLSVVLTKETLEGGTFSSCTSRIEFYKVRFSKDVNDMYCRISKTMRQASNVHPNVMLAVAQKI